MCWPEPPRWSRSFGFVADGGGWLTSQAVQSRQFCVELASRAWSPGHVQPAVQCRCRQKFHRTRLHYEQARVFDACSRLRHHRWLAEDRALLDATLTSFLLHPWTSHYRTLRMSTHVADTFGLPLDDVLLPFVPIIGLASHVAAVASPCAWRAQRLCMTPCVLRYPVRCSPNPTVYVLLMLSTASSISLPVW